MAYYKIKNITNTLGKRDTNKNKTLNIKYNVGFMQKNYSLGVGNEMIISCNILPTTVQSLRIKGFVTVREISENEFLKSQRPNAVKKVTPEPKKVVAEKPVKKTKKKTETTPTKEEVSEESK